MTSAEARQAAAERQRLKRARDAAGRCVVPSFTVGDEYRDLLIELGIASESEVQTPEGMRKATVTVIEYFMEQASSDLENDIRPLPEEFVAFPPDGEPLSSWQKVAWVRAHGLRGAPKHELDRALRKCGLIARWYAAAEGDQSDEEV